MENNLNFEILINHLNEWYTKSTVIVLVRKIILGKILTRWGAECHKNYETNWELKKEHVTNNKFECFCG